MNYIKEETILSPSETRFTIDAWLQDTDYLTEPNRDGVYSLSFTACSMSSHQNIFERVESAVMNVELRKSPYSNKVAKPKCENKRGEAFCSQLFAPKVNKELEHPSLYYGRKAEITLYLRDDVQGTIYLQADYVNLYPVEQPKQVMMDCLYDPELDIF